MKTNETEIIKWTIKKSTVQMETLEKEIDVKSEPFGGDYQTSQVKFCV
jgi:hypothetical protein